MYPSWDSVEYATTRLMSFWTTAMNPMNNAVIAPMVMTNDSATSLSSNSGDMRATMKMPAVTMVAAWISAESGVGPSVESVSHTCCGLCADLPMAPMNRQIQMTVSAFQAWPLKISKCCVAICPADAKAPLYCSEPVKYTMPAMPSRKPKSPTRLTRKAFMLAKMAVGRVYQKPISRYDTTPTASQPKNSCR